MLPPILKGYLSLRWALVCRHDQALPRGLMRPVGADGPQHPGECEAITTNADPVNRRVESQLIRVR